MLCSSGKSFTFVISNVAFTMNLQALIPDKIINKAPQAFAWTVQTLFAILMPEVYEKMPRHIVVTYLGLTPENMERLKLIVPAFIALMTCYKREVLSHIIHTAMPDNSLKCCIGN